MSEGKAKTLGIHTVRRRRGILHASLTCLEEHTLRLEIKERLSKDDQMMIQRLLKKLEALNSEFKSYHFTIVELIEDDEMLAKQQEVLDSHDDKVLFLTKILQHLVAETESTIRPSPPQSLPNSYIGDCTTWKAV